MKDDEKIATVRSGRRYTGILSCVGLESIHRIVDIDKMVSAVYVFLFMLRRPFVFSSFFVAGLHAGYFGESIYGANTYACRSLSMLGLCLDLLFYRPGNLIVILLSLLIGAFLYMKIVLAYTQLDEWNETVAVLSLLVFLASKNLFENISVFFSTNLTTPHEIYRIYSSVMFIQVLSAGVFSQISYRYVYNSLEIFGDSLLLNCINAVMSGVFVYVSYFVYEILYRDYTAMKIRCEMFKV